jgi:hypothetical protein
MDVFYMDLSVEEFYCLYGKKVTMQGFLVIAFFFVEGSEVV